MNPIGRCLMAVGVAVLGLSGCLGEEPEGPPPTAVDSILILGLREELAPDARRLFLEARTSTTYACFNYRIDHVAVVEARTIWIQFTGVSIGPSCLTATGPARATIPLGTLADGRYLLLLTVRGNAQASELTVTPQMVTVRPARGAWTVFEDSVLHRVTQGPATGG